jgi:hypothetical protein
MSVLHLRRADSSLAEGAEPAAGTAGADDAAASSCGLVKSTSHDSSTVSALRTRVSSAHASSSNVLSVPRLCFIHIKYASTTCSIIPFNPPATPTHQPTIVTKHRLLQLFSTPAHQPQSLTHAPDTYHILTPRSQIVVTNVWIYVYDIYIYIYTYIKFDSITITKFAIVLCIAFIFVMFKTVAPICMSCKIQIIYFVSLWYYITL